MGGLMADAARLGPGYSTRFRQWDGLIRRPVSSACRIDMISTSGGSGCSHVAARLGVLLANRRQSRILGVDAGTAAAFTRLVGAVPTDHAEQDDKESVGTARQLHAPVSVNLADEVTAAMLTGEAGLRVARPVTVIANVVRPTDWAHVIGPVSRFFDVVVTDWGHRLPGVDFEAALRGCGAVALVCRADRASVEQAMSVARVVNTRAGCVVCVSDVDAAGPRAARTAASWGLVPVEYIPFMGDPGASFVPFRVRETMIRLAATLMGFATDETRHSVAVGGLM